MINATGLRSFLLTSTLIVSGSMAIGQEQPADFLTEEFLANYGLGLIGAQDAYAAGFTGKGVTIAIVDGPIQFSHPEFKGRIVFRHPTVDVSPSNIDSIEHGTHVAGIAAAARDGRGMMGVAFDAVLAGVALDFDAVEENADDLNIGFAIVESGASVMNGSFGNDEAPAEYLNDGSENPFYQVSDYNALPEDEFLFYVDLVRTVDEADVAMIFATGNSQTSQPIAAQNPLFPAFLPIITPEVTAEGSLYRILDDSSDVDNPNSWISSENPALAELDLSDLRGSMIAVAAIGMEDGELIIADFTNYCGLAADWCVAAPGWDIYSTYPVDTYDLLDGTSMAAPHVTGVTALVRQAFPYMTARQAIEIVLTTAEDYDVDPTILGHGIVNAGRAVRGPVEFGHPSLLPGQDSIFAPVFAVDTEGHDSVWSNDIAGTGGFRKSGDGQLTLTGDNSYTGATEILGGTLRVDGSIASSDLSVATAARLEGRGTLGTAQVAGTIAPGNSVGTLSVAGDLTLQDGARIEAEIDGTGADLIAVTGDVTIDPNVTLVMLAQPGFSLDTGYQILTTGGTITGNIANVEDPHLFLDARLVAGVSALTLTAERNATDFAGFAQTANQRALAQAFDGLAPAAPAVEPVLLSTSAAALPALFSTLSGEIYASLPTARMGAAMDLSGLLSARLAQGPRATPGGSPRFWAETHGARGQFAGGGLAADLDHSHRALTLGMEVTGEADVTFGMGLSLAQGLAQTPGARAETDDVALIAYGGLVLEGLRLSGGITHLRSKADVTRAVAGLADTQLRGHLTHAFVELGLPRDVSTGLRIEPFLRAGHVRLRQNGVTETGAAQALSAAAVETEVTQATLGVRLSHEWKGTDRPWRLDATAAWQTNHGDTAPGLAVDLATGGAPFAVTGARLPEDALMLDFGISAPIGQFGRFNLALGGGFGDGAHDYRMQGGLEWRF